jgi:hypothetical protein
MFSFVTSCVKWIALCLWLVVGAVSFLAAQNLSRQLDAAKAEFATYKSQTQYACDEARRISRQTEADLQAYKGRLTDAHKLCDTAVESANKWRSKFEAICQQVQSLSVDVKAFTE